MLRACVRVRLIGAALAICGLFAPAWLAPGSALAARQIADDRVETQINEAVEIDVLANDPKGATLVDFSLPGHGEVSRRDNGLLRYVPSANFLGVDSFTYRASDSSGAVDAATVTIEVTGEMTRVEARNDSATTDESAAIRIIVLANDAQGPSRLPVRVSIESPPDHGEISIRPDQTVIYTPDAGWTGKDRFTYLASDGVTSDRATVAVTVRDMPDSLEQQTANPAANGDTKLVAADDEFLVVQDSPGNILDVASNDDTPGTGAYFIAIDTTPSSGTVMVDALQQVVYVPNPGFSGEDTFTYSLVSGSTRSSATVLIVVQGPNEGKGRGPKNK